MARMNVNAVECLIASITSLMFSSFIAYTHAHSHTQANPSPQTQTVLLSHFWRVFHPNNQISCEAIFNHSFISRLDLVVSVADARRHPSTTRQLFPLGYFVNNQHDDDDDIIQKLYITNGMASSQSDISLGLFSPFAIFQPFFVDQTSTVIIFCKYKTMIFL